MTRTAGRIRPVKLAAVVKTGNWASERIAPTAEKIEKMERKNGRTKKLTTKKLTSMTKKWTSINWNRKNEKMDIH